MIKLVFVGDIMQHREQLESAHISGTDTSSPESYDYGSYFKYTGRFFRDSDLTVANMEFTCGRAPYSGYPKFRAPSSLPKAAKNAGIDLFLCANNHICDYRSKGILSTLKSYNSLGIFHTGLYRNRLDYLLRHPLVLNVTDRDGLTARIAFINFTEKTNGEKVDFPRVVSMMNCAHIYKSVLKAKKRGAEYIIALPHWGPEYQTNPSAIQRKWQKFMFACGVDAIVGYHPHVLQPMEMSGDKITIFSTGTFISNLESEESHLGSIFSLYLTRDADGKVRLCKAEREMIWCAKDKGPEKGWTTVPVREFITSPERFSSRDEYEKMKYYNEKWETR